MEGAENINARTVSNKLNCSTQPIMYHFATIEELIPVISAMQETMNFNLEQTKEVFITLALFVHGYASIIANNSLEYDEKLIEEHQVIIAAFGEEIAYRGFFFGKSSKLFPVWVCAASSSIVFAAGHIAAGNPGIVLSALFHIFLETQYPLLLYMYFFESVLNKKS